LYCETAEELMIAPRSLTPAPLTVNTSSPKLTAWPDPLKPRSSVPPLVTTVPPAVDPNAALLRGISVPPRTIVSPV